MGNIEVKGGDSDVFQDAEKRHNGKEGIEYYSSFVYVICINSYGMFGNSAFIKYIWFKADE